MLYKPSGKMLTMPTTIKCAGAYVQVEKDVVDHMREEAAPPRGENEKVTRIE